MTLSRIRFPLCKSEKEYSFFKDAGYLPPYGGVYLETSWKGRVLLLQGIHHLHLKQ